MKRTRNDRSDRNRNRQPTMEDLQRVSGGYFEPGQGFGIRPTPGGGDVDPMGDSSWPV